jgi:hypothetical protein
MMIALVPRIPEGAVGHSWKSGVWLVLCSIAILVDDKL